MPVAGLPAAAEAVLSSLLTTEILSSWKVVGEEGNSIVVLRFRQAGSQPFLSNNIKRGVWRRKTPSQQRRDQRRAESHRAMGERKFYQNTASVNIENEHAANFAVHHDVARVPHAAAALSQTLATPLTFDLPSRQDDFVTESTESEACETAAAKPLGEIETNTTTTAVITPLSPKRGLTIEECKEIVRRVMGRVGDEVHDCQHSLGLQDVRDEVAIAAAPRPGQDANMDHQTLQGSSSVPSGAPGFPASSHAPAPPADDPDIVPIPDRMRPTSRRRARKDDDTDQPRGRSVHAAAKQQAARTARTARK